MYTFITAVCTPNGRVHKPCASSVAQFFNKQTMFECGALLGTQTDLVRLRGWPFVRFNENRTHGATTATTMVYSVQILSYVGFRLCGFSVLKSHSLIIVR